MDRSLLLNISKNILFLGFILIGFNIDSHANNEESLDIQCAHDGYVNYSDIHYIDYNHYKPVVHGYGYHIEGPWVDKHINCYSGHIKVTWRIKDHYGKWHYCYTKIWVENDHYQSNSLTIECPYDEWIYCDDLHYYQFKKPKVHSYGHYEIFGPWKEKHLNNCGIGHIKVSWKIVDECGKQHYCEYLVKIKGHEYGSPVKYWPADFWTDECEADLDPKYLGDHYGYPHLSNKGNCSELGISYHDEIFYPVTTGYHDKPDFCYKILRTWSVIDWCNYDAYSYNHNSYGNSGYGSNSYGKWTHTQLIKVKGGSAPVIECPEDKTVTVSGNASTAFVDLDEATASLSDGSCSDKLHITNDSKYADSHGADASGHYPMGVHWVTFKVADGCHNHTSCKVKITVRDEHAPTPYCHTKIVTDIGWHNDGLYTVIDPKLFDAGSYDNVTPNHYLDFRAEPSRLDCDDIGTNEIKIFVIDEFGNENFCTATLILQDNLGMCPQDSSEQAVVSLSGNIVTEGGMAVQEALVNFEGVGMVSTMTDQLGNFSIDIAKDQGYVVKPHKDIHFTDGVTTLDYIMLFNYVAGNIELDSPYKMIAADVDGSGVIDVMDVFKLGSMILNRGEAMPEGSKSWRFVDANYVFPNPVNPFENPFPEAYDLAMVTNPMSSLNFIGVKLGDIDGTLSRTGASLRNKEEPANLELYTRQNGNNTELWTKNGQQFKGAMFSINLEEGVLTELHVNAKMIKEEQVAKIIWTHNESVNEVKLLSISKTGLELTKHVNEAVDQNDLNGQVIIKNDLIANGSFKLYQNTPNPFSKNTIIPFDLMEDGPVTLTIYDIAGKEVWNYQTPLLKGFHQIELDGAKLHQGGVYYYTLKTKSDRTTQKMVLIK